MKGYYHAKTSAYPTFCTQPERITRILNFLRLIFTIIHKFIFTVPVIIFRQPETRLLDTESKIPKTNNIKIQIFALKETLFYH